MVAAVSVRQQNQKKMEMAVEGRTAADGGVTAAADGDSDGIEQWGGDINP
jgi:hypothetical protein